LSGPGAKSTEPGSDWRLPSTAKSNENGVAEMASDEASRAKLTPPATRETVSPGSDPNEPPVPAIPPEQTKAPSEGFDTSPPSATMYSTPTKGAAEQPEFWCWSRSMKTSTLSSTPIPLGRFDSEMAHVTCEPV
jgi:hypothetical protein